jgi:Domain of unknown function (DUF4112)
VFRPTAPGVFGIAFAVVKTQQSDHEAKTIEVEVLPPERKAGKRQEIDAVLDLVTKVMDTIFRMPGTKFRFGINPLIGLIPVIGDQIDAFISTAVLFGSVRHRLPKIVLARMALNVLLNALFQGIPIVGDLFTFFFKANRRNYELLRKHAGTGKPVTRGDWIFVGVIIGIIFLIAISLSFLLIYAVWLTDPRWW